MSSGSDPSDGPTRPVLSTGFWLMLALSGLSLAAAAVVAFRPARPAGVAPGAPKSTLSSPAAVRPGPHAAVDLSDPDAWLETSEPAPDYRVDVASSVPTEAVEVDDDFGAALQPGDGGSIVAETIGLIRTLGEWAKGR